MGGCAQNHAILEGNLGRGYFVQAWGGEFAANEVERSVIVLGTDSESAKALVENPIYHFRTKHITAKYHISRDRVVEGEIVLEWVKSIMNIADMMTKHASIGVQKTIE